MGNWGLQKDQIIYSNIFFCNLQKEHYSNEWKCPHYMSNINLLESNTSVNAVNENINRFNL